MSKAKRPKTKSNGKGKGTKGSPRQTRVPGTEDKKVQVLIDLGQELHEARTKRLSYGTREHQLEDQMLAEMKRRKMSKYAYGRMTLDRHVKKEIVKVKFAPEE